MRRITLSTEESKSKTNKKNWVFLFKNVAELCPEDNPYFAEEQEKLSAILEIVESLTGKELNEFANLMRTKADYQMLYRDGHWLDSPEDYNTKTQALIDKIFTNLSEYQTNKSLAKLERAVKRQFQGA